HPAVATHAGMGECNHGPVMSLLDTRSNDAAHALLPVCVEETLVVSTRAKSCFMRNFGLLLHVGLDAAPREIELVQLPRQRQRLGIVVSQQAGDAKRHVVEAAGSIEPRPDAEAEIACTGAQRIAARQLQQRAYAWAAAAGADA